MVRGFRSAFQTPVGQARDDFKKKQVSKRDQLTAQDGILVTQNVKILNKGKINTQFGS